jgi:hypothetical protein
LERIAAMLEMRGKFSDADVAKLALTGSGTTTASGVNLVSYPK